MDDEARRVLAVRSPLEGERACEELRAHGIKCACVELPSERAQALPVEYMLTAGQTGMELCVVVAPRDEERARAVLASWPGSR